MVAPPDYRDQFVDLIEEHFGSTSQFCQETGIDRSELGRILAGKKDGGQETLGRTLDILGVEFTLVDREELAGRAWLEVGPLSRPDPGAAIPARSG